MLNFTIPLEKISSAFNNFRLDTIPIILVSNGSLNRMINTFNTSSCKSPDRMWQPLNPKRLEEEYYFRIIDFYNSYMTQIIPDFETCAYRELLCIIHEEEAIIFPTSEKILLDRIITNTIVLILSLTKKSSEKEPERIENGQKQEKNYIKNMMQPLVHFTDEI